jgi:hypothetical protein
MALSAKRQNYNLPNSLLIPAKAGIPGAKHWMPAFAGMTTQAASFFFCGAKRL